MQFESRGIPLIISGAPRSGTTLIYNLIDGHSQISWLVTEAYFFEYLYDAGVENEAVYRALAQCGVDALIDGIRDRAVVPPLQNGYRQIFPGNLTTAATYEVPWNEQVFRRRLEELDFNSMAEFWGGLARACLDAIGQEERRYVCIKSPDYGKSAAAGLATVPRARAIIILRDPLLALDSLKFSREKRNAKRLTWPTLAIRIGNYLQMFRLIDALPQDRIKVLRYEDLVRSPKTIMTDLAEWLGVEFEETLLHPTFLGKSWTGHSTQKITSGIEADLADREVKYLTACEKQAVLQSLDAPMRKFGYC